MPGASTNNRPPNTFEEGLTELYSDAARLALAPDATPHMQFIQLMQEGILKYRSLIMQQKSQAATQMQQQLAGQTAGMGGGPPQDTSGMMGGGPPGMPPGAGGPGGPPGQPQQIAPGGGAGNSGYGGVVSPDDLQRVLAGAGGQ